MDKVVTDVLETYTELDTAALEDVAQKMPIWKRQNYTNIRIVPHLDTDGSTEYVEMVGDKLVPIIEKKIDQTRIWEKLFVARVVLYHKNQACFQKQGVKSAMQFATDVVGELNRVFEKENADGRKPKQITEID